MTTMAPTPLSTKSWQNMTRTRHTLAKKYQQIAGVSVRCFDAMSKKKNKYLITKKITFSSQVHQSEACRTIANEIKNMLASSIKIALPCCGD
jgi:hypothetical protein